MTRGYLPVLAAAAWCLGVLPQARAHITIGAIVSAAGPAASLGILERNTIELLPRLIAGEKYSRSDASVTG